MHRETVPPHRIFGIDFSGATEAGRRTWVASGVVADARLTLHACERAEDLPRSGRDRDRALAALRDLVGREREAVFGFDFPFGLPRELVKETTWTDFVLVFPDRYPTPERFREACRAAAGGRELKRATDREARTPFSAYNIRLFRQTYHGIRDVLFPIVRDRLASVAPMQEPAPGRAIVLEICPASTLKHDGDAPYESYKRKASRQKSADDLRARRAHILARLEMSERLVIATERLRQDVLDDPGGDALDSVIAAFAAARALRNPDDLIADAGSA